MSSWSYRVVGAHKTYNDPREMMTDILTNVTMRTGVPEPSRLSYMNAFVKLLSRKDFKYEDLGYTAYDILYCFRPLCFLESVRIRNSIFRALRHFIKTEEHVDIFNKLKYDYLIAREVTAGGLQLCRRIIVVSPQKLTHAPVRAVVAFTHPSHTDNLQSAALALLAEIALLNADLFITCGGVSAIIRNLSCLKSPKMTEALLGSLLYLVNKPETRAKAGINLQCLTGSVYMDRGLNSKNNSTTESTVRWCTTAMVCLLRSWTGILHLCQGKRQAITSIVDSLYVTHLQKPILEVLYKLFDLTQPDWTDEITVALEAVHPSKWSDSFRIAEGFIAAEAQSLFPHLAKTRVNLIEVHRAFVLYLFLKANVLEAIVHVVVSDDTFLSVHATILLGELLHLVHTILPPELISLTPGLPNLLSYAVRGRPVNIVPQSTIFENEELPNNAYEELFGPGFTMDQSLLTNSDVEPSKEAQERALRAVCAMSYLHKRPPGPSLYLRHLISWIKSSESPLSEKPQPLAKHSPLSSCDESIKESGVLAERDPYTWNWDVIRAILKRHGETLRKTTDSNKKLFLRRLINFLLPVTGQYGRTELVSNRKSNNLLTLAGLDLISMLLLAPEESECEKLLFELLGGIRTQFLDLARCSTSRSAHDCHLSPINISNSLCQDYFLMVGHLSTSEQGRKALTTTGIYTQLLDLVASTNQDCYIKLIVSTMDFANDEQAKNILKKIFESKSISCRLYATKSLHAMMRIGVGHDRQLMSFLVGLIVDQLSDEDRNVAAVALNAIQEASHSKEYVEAIVEQRPCLMRHGDNGLLVLVRCLSTEEGFRRLHQANFVTAQLAKWGTHYNYRYVNIVEGLLASEGNQSTEVFLPPHLYQQLASHQTGLAMVLANDHVIKLVQVLEHGDCSTDEQILEMKAALYALSGIAGVMDINVLSSMIRIATHCLVYSLRAVAFTAISNVATSVQGEEKLKSLGWYSVKHDRHEMWPLVTPTEEDTPNIIFERNVVVRENKSPLFDLPEEDDNLEDIDKEEFFWGVPGGRTQRIRERRSATLPHSTTPSSYYHNRSYSESKAEHSDSSDYTNEHIVHYKSESGRKSRSNSYTDSSTSGDSTYGMRHYSVSDRVPTLSPIPSAGSLTAFNPQTTKRTSLTSNFSRSSLRGSRQSILRSLEQSSTFPLGLITYGDLLCSPSPRQKHTLNELQWSETPAIEEPDFSTLETSLIDTTSLQSNSNDGLDVPMPIYMGICLPAQIGCLFPKEEINLVKKHVSFISESLKVQGLQDLKNPSFHKEICFLGPQGCHNMMVNTSECEPSYLVEGDLELDKETLENDSVDSSMTDVQSFVDKPMPIIFKSRIVIRNELARMIEQLSNPILHKTCKQSLLQIKQAHGDLFQDICVFSDVCHILSTCQVRVASRDFVNKLFDSAFDEIWHDVAVYLKEHITY
ncbi:rapamycin-insensitive companion of mTOR isoform X2 [Cimex lectularius]|uniref:Rapamycin-insensitive companion of mTOR n=1 Tax=Cimex lectularius TaxID=79782 RepID=A0A8I6R6M0_CIMLE|nr:rapamycin-insensitive companion of mTOR isoform X2 [Cimex lectularius]